MPVIREGLGRGTYTLQQILIPPLMFKSHVIEGEPIAINRA